MKVKFVTGRRRGRELSTVAKLGCRLVPCSCLLRTGPVSGRLCVEGGLGLGGGQTALGVGAVVSVRVTEGFGPSRSVQSSHLEAQMPFVGRSPSGSRPQLSHQCQLTLWQTRPCSGCRFESTGSANRSDFYEVLWKQGLLPAAGARARLPGTPRFCLDSRTVGSKSAARRSPFRLLRRLRCTSGGLFSVAQVNVVCPVSPAGAVSDPLSSCDRGGGGGLHLSLLLLQQPRPLRRGR